VHTRAREFYALLLALETGMIGTFLCMDLLLFYLFWEAMLIPMYLLIGVWGGQRRVYAAVKFFLYTMAGSVLMLVAILWMYFLNRSVTGVATFDLEAFYQLSIPPEMQVWLFLAFAIAFAIKVPMFPFHTWLPDAHVEAPTAGSVILAAILLKMGTFGFVRYAIPLFPVASHQFTPWIVGLAIIGIIYGALVAMVQPNVKKLVAYSSVSHLGFVVLGLFSFTPQGLDGAVYQMLSHGISTGALFILVGYMYERRHSLEIADYGGVATPAPWLSTVFMITMLASIGLPTLNNFVGEYLVLQGTAMENFTWTAWAAIGVILSACYMLWMYQRTFFGEASEKVRSHMHDLNARELAGILPLVVMMVWMGMVSQSFLPSIGAANAEILKRVEAEKEIRVNVRSPRMPLVAEVTHVR
jgi:NADH-quinone oxidoreductase subunit M